MANRVLTRVSTFVGGAGAAQSGFVTFSFANTAGFESLIPVRITNPGTTSISAGAEVTVFRTADGTVWESAGNLAQVFARPTAASQVQIRDVQLLDAGRFIIAVNVGGGAASTWTAEVLTAEVVTAVG